MLRRSRRSSALTTEGAAHVRDELVQDGYEMLIGKEDEIPDDPMPQPTDSDEVFKSKKLALLEKMVPHSLVPASTANAMLIMGAKLGPESCYFEVHTFLIVAGAISLSLVFIPVLARHLLELILADKKVTRGEQRIIGGIYYLGSVLGVVEVLLILIGSIIVFPNLQEVQFTDKKAPKYCDYGAATFLEIYLSMSWIFIGLGSLSFIYIKSSEMRKRKRRQADIRAGSSHKKPH